MNYSKRHGEILKLLQEEGTITIASLAERLGVSLETVRRDVKPLTSDGSVLKMHGAIGLPSMVGEAPFERRMREQGRRQARHRQAGRRHHRRRRIRHARHRHDDQLPRPRAARPPPPDGGHQFVRHRPHARHRERQQGLHGRRRAAQRFRRGLRRLGDRVRQPLQRQPRRHHRRRHRCRRTASWTMCWRRRSSRASC